MLCGPVISYSALQQPGRPEQLISIGFSTMPALQTVSAGTQRPDRTESDVVQACHRLVRQYNLVVACSETIFDSCQQHDTDRTELDVVQA